MPLIADLQQHPQHLDFVAHLVWREFWADVPGGMSQAELATAFGGLGRPGWVLASLIALDDDGSTPLGCVHLIDNDDSTQTELYPWLAAMVVVSERRGQGIGSMLVRAMAREAKALGFEQLWFGTDGPGFYERLGALRHHERKPGFWTMKLPLRAPRQTPASPP